MKTSIEHVGNVPVVSLSGRLDTMAAPEFDAEMAPLLAEPRPRILLDLSQVTYVSSAGLRSVLQLVKHTTSHGGKLGVFSVQPNVMEVIEISGFPSLLDVYPDRETALSGSAA